MTTALPPSGLNRFAAVAPVAAIAIGLAIALPPFLSFVVVSGANIPAPDLAGDLPVPDHLSAWARPRNGLRT